MQRQMIVRFHNTFSKKIPSVSKISDVSELKKHCDYISPADRVSNIRRIRYGRRPDETAEEMTLRLYASELHEWNHRHWQKQNSSYSSLKQQLLDEIEENDIEDEQEIERIMEEFYRTYLLSNKENFNRYSKEWRNANIKLIYLSLRAKKSRASKKLWDKIAFMR